jgi:hypothetical protein
VSGLPGAGRESGFEAAVESEFELRFERGVDVDVGVDIAGITRIHRAPECGHVNVALPASYVAVQGVRRRLSPTSQLRETTPPPRGFDRTR